MENFNSSRGEIESRIVLVFVVDIMFVACALFGVQEVRAYSLDLVTFDLIKDASGPVYYDQIGIRSGQHCLQEDHFLTLPSVEAQNLLIVKYLMYRYFAIVQSNESQLAHNVAAENLQISQGLAILANVNLFLHGNAASRIVPNLELELLADGHDLLLVVLVLLDVHDHTAVFVHVFDAFVIFQIPDFHIALGHRDEDVRFRHRVYLCHLVPVALIDHAELAL